MPRGLIIFDMDGVLVDVSSSYRETVRQAAAYFLSRAKSFDLLPDPLFSLEDLAAVKQRGGLNNDWDLTRLVCSLLFSKLDAPRISQAADAWRRYGETMPRCDAARLVRFIGSHAMPLSVLFTDEANRTNAFVEGLYRGDVGSGNIIKQIFQEIYLGKTLFEKTYGMPACTVSAEGLYHREFLIIEKTRLQRLARSYVLGIATGRPAAEAVLPLRHYGLASFFSRVYTLDDCLAAEKEALEITGDAVTFSKPSPFMLDRIVEELNAQHHLLFYVGDMPDDMRAAAASRYEFKSIGFLAASPDRPRLRADLERAGADKIIESASALENYFLKSGRG